MQSIAAILGGLYSIVGDADFGVVKVLALDPGIVHLRSYAERFSERPFSLAGVRLSLGSTKNAHFGIGHFPLAEEGFANMRPAFLEVRPVSEDELEGYHIWREAWEGGEAGVYSDAP